METARKFDIFANLPAELLLELFEWLPPPEVVRLCCVSKTWKARIEGLKWRDKVHSLQWVEDKDWPVKLPLQIHCRQLPGGLRYLDISAIRLSSAWTERLVEVCPILKTLIIRNMYSANLDPGVLLSGSRIEVLNLMEMTYDHCKTWFPSLSRCTSLRDFQVTVLPYVERITPASQANQPPSEPQGLFPALRTLGLESVPFPVFPPEASLQSRERTQWDSHLLRRTDLERRVTNRQRRARDAILSSALLDLQRHAPELHTLDITGIESRLDDFTESFLHGFFTGMVSREALRNISFNDMTFMPEWLHMCTILKLHDIEVLHPRLHYLPSSSNPIWEFPLETLDISFSVHCQVGFITIPLAQNLVHLKLSDPEGMLSNALFYTLLQGGLLVPLISLRTLSLSRLPAPEQDSTERAFVRSTPSFPVGFDTIGRGDIMRLGDAFPMLVDLKIIRVVDIPASTVRTILELRLRYLERLTIVEKDRVGDTMVTNEG